MWPKSTLSLIILTLSYISAARNLHPLPPSQLACPPAEAVYPCICDTDFQGFTAVRCTGSSMEKLKLVMENTKGWNVSFEFWKCHLGDIPSHFFQGQKSISLHFENCHIGSFGDRPFTGLESTLNKLYIYDSVDKRRKDLETFPLGHLKQLKQMYFMVNYIERLGNEWFKDGPLSLVVVDLQANGIEELGDKAFSHLENMQRIWLGENRFKTVSRTMFARPAKHLKWLEISSNGIEILPEDFFQDMPKLNNINISGNKLKTLSEATWGKIWDQLDEVFVSRNYGLTCDERIRWIYERKSRPRLFDAACGGQNHLRGKKLEDLNLEDFN